jgi:transcriptional regulator with XRE-family HTH domain
LEREFKQANAIDVAIGDRIRRARALLGWSQSKLGQAIGVSFQQVQKYETGATRLSANRLVLLSDVLQVPVSFLLQKRQGVERVPQLSEEESESAEVVQAFLTIENPKIRNRMLELLRALAEERPSTCNEK